MRFMGTTALAVCVLLCLALPGCTTLGDGKLSLDPRDQATLIQVAAGPQGWSGQYYHGPAPVLVEAAAETGEGKTAISSDSDNATSIWAAAVSALAGFVAGGI